MKFPPIANRMWCHTIYGPSQTQTKTIDCKLQSLAFHAFTFQIVYVFPILFDRWALWYLSDWSSALLFEKKKLCLKMQRYFRDSLSLIFINEMQSQQEYIMRSLCISQLKEVLFFTYKYIRMATRAIDKYLIKKKNLCLWGPSVKYKTILKIYPTILHA